jgi:hypothetical protein
VNANERGVLETVGLGRSVEDSKRRSEQFSVPEGLSGPLEVGERLSDRLTVGGGLLDPLAIGEGLLDVLDVGE